MTKEDVLNLLRPITISKVVSKVKHSNADRLWVLQVDNGSGNNVQVVTGANNFEEGDLVAHLAPGNIVPGWLIDKGEEVKLTEREMRGEMSSGMLLAEDEIGLGEDHDGILIVSEKNSKLQLSNSKQEDLIGKSLNEILKDEIIEFVLKKAKVFEITPEMQEKIDLITRDLEEVIGKEDIAPILAERPLRVYWGTAPTGKPSVGYFVPMIKISDFLKAGCEVTVLLANIHAFLDNMKSSWDVVNYRSEYYKLVITEILKVLGTPLDKLKFIEGSSYQLDSKYTMDMYKIATMTTIQSVKGAGAEVVKQVESPVLGGMLYPILQALDEQYLEVDAQLGGLDQRKIFMFAREYLPKLDYKKRIHLMNPLIPGLGKSGKMSSSEPNSKIDFEDTDENINDKISKALSVDKEVEGNGLLALLKYVIFKRLEVKNEKFNIEREKKWGGNAEYLKYSDLEKDFVEGKLSSVDLKPAVSRELIKLVEPIRKVINDNAELVSKAYPIN